VARFFFELGGRGFGAAGLDQNFDSPRVCGSEIWLPGFLSWGVAGTRFLRSHRSVPLLRYVLVKVVNKHKNYIEKNKTIKVRLKI
jgi:hypothetical protein